MPEETKVTDNTQKEEFLQNFIRNKNEVQSVSIAKEQDKINLLEAKIKDINASKESRNDTIKACRSVIDSNAYPKLNPIISSFSAHLEKLDKKKDKKIVKAEKKLKKSHRKIKKLKSKQKRSELLKTFLSSMIHNSSDKQTAYIEAMRALKEDSLGRADRQLDKTEARLVKLTEKLKSGKLSEVDKIKLEARIKKVESKKEKLISRINNLNELEQELNKLAKIKLVDDKVDELRNTAVETAEKAAMNGSSVSETIDNVTESSNEIIKETLESDKIEEAEKDKAEEKQAEVQKQQAENQEKSNEKASQTENEANSNAEEVIRNPVKRTGMTQKQLLKLMGAGIAIQVSAKTAEKGYTVIFDKSKTEEVNNILQATKTKKR